MVFLISAEYQTHIELYLSKKSDANADSVSYSKSFFFFLGFHQIASKYVNRFEKIMRDFSLFDLKVVLIKMKSYKPEQSVGFIYSENDLAEMKEIFSYYRTKRNDMFLITEIFWDPCLDIQIARVIMKEYIKLGHDWNKIMVCGFSMGGRYAIHLLELLNAKVHTMMLVKTYIMQYLKGESQIEVLKAKLNENSSHFSEEKYGLDTHQGKLKSNCSYSSDMFEAINISRTLNELQSLNEYVQSNDKTKPNEFTLNSKFVVDNINFVLRYSIHDPLTMNVLEETLNSLQSQLQNYRISFDLNDQHQINSATDLIGETIQKFLNFEIIGLL